MKKYELICKDYPHFLHGGDYNPEQWIHTPEIWDEDMRLMKEANCNEMTVGIFSWAELEPEEGKFNFGWLDEIIEKIYKNDGRVVLATPSGARPKWLSDKYPEVLRVQENGIRNHFGARHNHCSTSLVYREKVRIINEKLAERYGKHPAVVAWHLSNEYNGGACYCDNCIQAFRDWLKKKYDNNIEKVNHAWWTRFWSHTYRSFDQIEPPRMIGGEMFVQGLSLDWKRFCSDMTVDFAAKEAETVRKYSDYPITTNCMCNFSGFDHYKMAEVLDVACNDFYPRWSKDVAKTAQETAAVCALYRGLKDGKPFMVMESAPGINTGGMRFPKLKTDAEQFFEAMLFVACGADTVQYFQWRKGRGGHEKFHGAVVDHYGKTDNRVFQCVKRTGEALQKIEGVLGTGMQAEVAMVRDYETVWALNGTPEGGWNEPGHGYYEIYNGFFGAAWNKNIPVDIISYASDFSKYKVLCLPVPYLMKEENAKKLKDFVAKGGVLISTYMTAVANENDLCYLGGMPGANLAELFGLRVDEVDNYATEADGVPLRHKNSVVYKDTTYPVEGIAERIIPDTAESLAEFTDGIQKNMPAVLCNKFGAGKAYYIGFLPDLTFTDTCVGDILEASGVRRITEIETQAGVQVTCRKGDGKQYFFVLNCSDSEKQINIKNSYVDLLTNREVCGKHTVAPLQVMVLTKKD